ncbi:MAG: hypothetical protein ICV59_06160 [Thermoleophilia bacterium]|nr:hypothetical protein [Thermoleophilia bacterium]
MAVSLTVEFDAEELTLGRFQQLTRSLSTLVQEVGGKVAEEHRDPLRWIVANVRKQSPYLLELTPERTRDDVPPDLPARAASAIASGIALIQQRAERPPYYSDRALEQARDLASANGEVRAVRISAHADGQPVERVTLTPTIVANVEELIGGQVESFGTIEGRLEGVLTHERRRFFVWESLTGRRVECRFGDRIPLDDVLKAYSKRVSARGIIRRRRTGEPVSIEGNELRVFPSEDALPETADLKESRRPNE